MYLEGIIEGVQLESDIFEAKGVLNRERSKVSRATFYRTNPDVVTVI